MKSKKLSGKPKSRTMRTSILAVMLTLIATSTMSFAVGFSCKGTNNSNNSSGSEEDSGFIDVGGDDNSENSSESKNSKIILNEVENKDSVKILDDAVRAYLLAETEADQASALPKDDPSTNKVETNLTADKGALPVTLEWERNGSVSYTLIFADNTNFTNPMTYTLNSSQHKVSIYNLSPATTYYWKVEGSKQNDTSEVSSFTTEDIPVRFIYAEGGSNIRDLGGWNAENGVRLNYGKIYRGNQLNGYANANYKLTESGIETFKDELKIRTEVDLRIKNRDDANQKENFFDSSLPYYKLTLGQYTDILDDASLADVAEGAKRTRDESLTLASLKKLFEVLSDENNYPVYIHCNSGADRTGTVAFLINGLLGVSEEDLVRDFELTSFSAASGFRYRSNLNEDKTGFTDTGVYTVSGNFVAYGALVDAMKAAYGAPDKPLSYAIEKYLTSYIGVSYEQIEKIKSIMLPDYVIGEGVEYLTDRQSIDATKTDNVLTLGDITYTSVESITLGKVSLGTDLNAINGVTLGSIYGENSVYGNRDLKVVVNTDSGKKTVIVPVLVVTKYISNATELIEALKITSGKPFGYYELKDDITLDALTNDIGDVVFNGSNGFNGIFDGKGFTITAPLGAHGLFGFANGATIRNVNFEVSDGLNVVGNSVLADHIIDSTIVDVEITVNETTASNALTNTGFVTSTSFKGNTVKNLTIIAQNASLNSLFGNSESYVFEDNNFEACSITAKSLNELAKYTADYTAHTVYLEKTAGISSTITDPVKISMLDTINVGVYEITLNVGDRFDGLTIEEVKCGNSILAPSFADGILTLTIAPDSVRWNVGDNVEIRITYTGLQGDTFKATISAMIFAPSTSVTLSGERQEILIGSEDSYTIELRDYAAATVYSVSCGNYFFGSNASALSIGSDFENDAKSHGETNLTVLLQQDGACYTVSVPVCVITKEINTIDELSPGNVSFPYIYGYYRLAADVGRKDRNMGYTDGNGFSGDSDWRNVNGTVGFHGTFDGAGHTITATFGAFGVFGVIGNGAVIKNLNLDVYGFANGRATMARSITGATIDTVTINFKDQTITVNNDAGAITSTVSHNTTYKNVTIDALGKDLGVLFGNSYWAYSADKANTFVECKVIAKSLRGLTFSGSLYPAWGTEGLTIELHRDETTCPEEIVIDKDSALTIGTDINAVTSLKLNDVEIDASKYTFEAPGTLTVKADYFTLDELGEKIFAVVGTTVNGEIVMFSVKTTVSVDAENVKLETKYEIILSGGDNSSSSLTVNLGDYQDGEVVSASIANLENSATYADGTLTLTESLIANKGKHGLQTLNIIVRKGGTYYYMTADILIVTQEITTVDELSPSGASFKEKYGYYRLGADVGASDRKIGSSDGNGDGGKWNNTDGSYGFHGTFDGCDHTITGIFPELGLFGVVGQGAIIKNLKLDVYGYSNSTTSLARSISSATIQNVTINMKDTSVSVSETGGGAITYILSYTTRYENVTLNAENLNLSTLFGNSFTAYTSARANTFVNSKIVAKSLQGVAFNKWFKEQKKDPITGIFPATGVTGLTVELHPDDFTPSEEIVINRDSALTISTNLKTITSIKLNGNDLDAANYEFEASGTLTVKAGTLTHAQLGKIVISIEGVTSDGAIVIYDVTTNAKFEAPEVKLEGTKEIVLVDGTKAYSLDLGADWADAEVISATIANENATYADGMITLSDEFISAPQKHGLQTLNLIVKQGDNYYNLTTSILVVTKEISTLEDLLGEKTKAYATVPYVHGYYRLKNDIGTGNDWILYDGGNGGDAFNPNGTSGFRGTLDGAGFTLTAYFRGQGLFGVIGQGAVIKDITLNAYGFADSVSILARSITGATIEDVTINIKNDPVTLTPKKEGGAITAILSHNTTYKNVTINAEGKNLDTLFGNSYGNYDPEKANTFVNCEVKAKSLAGLIYDGGDALPATGIEGLTVTIA